MEDAREVERSNSGPLYAAAIMVGIMGGMGIGYVAFKPAAIVNVPPFNIEDARSVLGTLNPVSKGGRFATSVWLWGDGDVNVSVKTSSGAEFTGRGGSLGDAFRDLQNQVSSGTAEVNALATALHSKKDPR